MFYIYPIFYISYIYMFQSLLEDINSMLLTRIPRPCSSQRWAAKLGVIVGT